MRAFIISLESEPERRRESVRLIEQSGLSYELVDAIDGRTTSNLPCSPQAWLGLKNTEVATYLSHLLALREILKKGLPYALVLEDDFEYLDGQRERLAEIENQLPGDFSYICLHNLKASINPSYSIAAVCPPFQLLNVPPLVACAYIVSAPLAQHILEIHATPDRPFDHVFVARSRESRWRFYDLVDPIITIRGVPSTVR